MVILDSLPTKMVILKKFMVIYPANFMVSLVSYPLKGGKMVTPVDPEDGWSWREIRHVGHGAYRKKESFWGCTYTTYIYNMYIWNIYIYMYIYIWSCLVGAIPSETQKRVGIQLAPVMRWWYMYTNVYRLLANESPWTTICMAKPALSVGILKLLKSLQDGDSKQQFFGKFTRSLMFSQIKCQQKSNIAT